MPDYGDLDGGANRFSSKYNSFRTNLVKRFSKGLQVNANYTWGRAMTNSSSLAEATVHRARRPRAAQVLPSSQLSRSAQPEGPEAPPHP